MRFVRDIRHTPDYDRIMALPRRRVVAEEAAALVPEWTARLGVPGAGVRLLPWQAYGLAEIERNRGALLGYPVGEGKTLILALAPTVLRAKRPVVIVPASLREKTFADFRAYFGRWKIPKRPITVLTREELQGEANADRLMKLKPDYIGIDEADELANWEASVPQRIERYRNEAGEDCVVVAATGSLTRKSIMGYWHLLLWALGADAPVYLDRSDAKQLALAIDDGVRGRRPRPGPWGATIEEARRTYLTRLAETPGVVLLDGDPCKAPLTVRVRKAPEDAVLDGHYKRFLIEDVNPDGFDVTDPLSRWRMDQQLGGAGMYLLMDPPPPKPWAEARRAFAAVVRTAIRNSRRSTSPLDTEAQVVRRLGPRSSVIQHWKAIEKSFEIRTRPVWLTESLLEAAEEWLRESDAPGIVWYGVVEFGQKLAERTRLPCFGPGGKDANGAFLHAARPHNIIVSWNANKRGFNLQAWKRMLIMQPPASAKFVEQIIGRVHRQHQHDPVTVDILAGSGGALDSIGTMLSEAQFAKETTAMTQKVLRADIEWPEIALTKSNRYRWAQQDKERNE